MENTLKTLQGISEGSYKEKGSRFPAFAMPVKSADEVKSLLAAYKKEHHKAKHICYAYRLGPDAALYRACDNGEPSGTAGRPILRQIEAAGLTDTLVVVVRYFGGTLLGTGGLVHAYKTASEEAVRGGTAVPL